MIDDRVIPKTNEKRSGSIVDKDLDLPPPKKKRGAAAVELEFWK